MMKEYRSFEEVERDLKILKLQTEIDKEEIKLALDQTKKSLSPKSLIGSTVSAVVQKALLLKATTKLLGLKRK